MMMMMMMIIVMNSYRSFHISPVLLPFDLEDAVGRYYFFLSLPAQGASRVLMEYQ